MVESLSGYPSSVACCRGVVKKTMSLNIRSELRRSPPSSLRFSHSHHQKPSYFPLQMTPKLGQTHSTVLGRHSRMVLDQIHQTCAQTLLCWRKIIILLQIQGCPACFLLLPRKQLKDDEFTTRSSLKTKTLPLSSLSTVK